MPFQPVPGGAQCVVQNLDDGEDAFIDLSFRNVSGNAGITPSTIAQLANLIGEWYLASMLPLLASTLVYSATKCIDLSNPNGPVAFHSGVGTGGVGTEQTPNNCALCIKFNTPFRGRSFRGRNFLPGLPNALVATNAIDLDFIAAVKDAYALLLPTGGVLDGSPWVWGVVSRKTDGITRTNGIVTDISAVNHTTRNVRSMRSREVGKGA